MKDGVVDDKDPAGCYWWQLDKAWLPKNRKNKLKKGDDGDYHGHITALKHDTITVKIEDGRAKAYIMMEGKPVWLIHVYIDHTSGWFGIPTVNWVRMTALDANGN